MAGLWYALTRHFRSCLNYRNTINAAVINETHHCEFLLETQRKSLSKLGHLSQFSENITTICSETEGQVFVYQ